MKMDEEKDSPERWQHSIREGFYKQVLELMQQQAALNEKVLRHADDISDIRVKMDAFPIAMKDMLSELNCKEHDNTINQLEGDLVSLERNLSKYVWMGIGGTSVIMVLWTVIVTGLMLWKG